MSKEEHFKVNTQNRARVVGIDADLKAARRLSEEVKPATGKERRIIKKSTTELRQRGKDN